MMKYLPSVHFSLREEVTKALTKMKLDIIKETLALEEHLNSFKKNRRLSNSDLAMTKLCHVY